MMLDEILKQYWLLCGWIRHGTDQQKEDGIAYTKMRLHPKMLGPKNSPVEQKAYNRLKDMV